jgi:DNA modification methylase
MIVEIYRVRDLIKNIKIQIKASCLSNDGMQIPRKKRSINGIWLRKAEPQQLKGPFCMQCRKCNKELTDKHKKVQKADMVSTDPPYGMDLDTDRRGMGNTTTVYNKVIGDSEPFDPQHIIGAFPETPMILWGADYYCQRIPNWSEGSPIVWAKAHSEDENKVWGSSFETAWVWPKKKRLLWFIRRIHMGSEHEGTHPTQKPTEITTRALELFDIKPNGIVVDLFGGSGSTLIACEKTNRKCFMMELDPHYCGIIIERWQKYTGKKAELLNGST